MTKRIVWIVVLGLFLSLPAAASQKHQRRWARVVSSTPIYESRRVVTPERECWTERVAYERRGRGHRYGHYRRHGRSPAPTLLGAAIGGVIGHELGRDRAGRRAGTVLGVVLGGSIGHELGHRRSHRGYGHHRRHRGHGHHRRVVEYREEERCDVRERVDYERYVVGYDVEYRYRGGLYRARMDEEPGKRIRVALDVTPIDD